MPFLGICDFAGERFSRVKSPRTVRSERPMYVGAKVYFASNLLHEEAKIVPTLVEPRVGSIGPAVGVVLCDLAHFLCARYSKLLSFCRELGDVGCPCRLCGHCGADNPVREQAVLCQESIAAEANGGSNDRESEGGGESPWLSANGFTEGTPGCFYDPRERPAVASCLAV